jgi:ATP-dependent DNA helicase RecG
MIIQENQSTEWKSVWNDEYLAWICGFANAKGGKLFIGVDNNGNIVGLKNSRKLMEDLPNKIQNAMGITVNITLHEDREGHKEYIEIDVPPHPVAISCKGSFYYRSGATNQMLKGAELETFIMRRRGVHWDSSPLPRVDFSNIDESVVKDFCERAVKKGRLDESVTSESVENIIRKLRMRNGEYLTNAALLAFGKDIDRWFTGAFIKVGFFETDADLIYMDEVHGPLLTLADKTLDLVYFKYLKAKISYKGIRRIERYPFPEEALREALINAIIHKDYASGVPIQISVYDDKLYIGNISRLPEHWTVKELLGKHASQPFNPSIAHAFYLAGFIESWGRGIEKIFNACKTDGIYDPEYTVHPGDIMIKFAAPEERVIRSGKRMITETGQVTGQDTGQVTNEVMRLLMVLNGEMKRSEIQAALGLSGLDNFRKLYLTPALQAGLIEMTIPDKPNSRSQKYKCSKKGKEIRNE